VGLPRTHHRIVELHRHAGFDQDLGAIDRIGGIATLGRDRLAEADRGRLGPLGRPGAEPFLHLAQQNLRIGIAGHHDDRVVGPIPLVVERLDALGRGGLERLDLADRERVAAGWPAKNSSRVASITRVCGPERSRISASTIGTSVFTPAA
jgi:hypothetical protein